MLGGYLEFFMEPAWAVTYLNLKKEIDELIQRKVRGRFIFLVYAGLCLLTVVKQLFFKPTSTSIKLCLMLVYFSVCAIVACGSS